LASKRLTCREINSTLNNDPPLLEIQPAILVPIVKTRIQTELKPALTIRSRPGLPRV
jgi:hypothetical protein